MTEERPAKRVHVFKCPECGNEERIDEKDLQPWDKFCGVDNCKNFEPIEESCIEIVDADGIVTAVIV